MIQEVLSNLPLKRFYGILSLPKKPMIAFHCVAVKTCPLEDGKGVEVEESDAGFAVDELLLAATFARANPRP